MKKKTPKNMANLRFSLEVFLKSVQSAKAKKFGFLAYFKL